MMQASQTPEASVAGSHTVLHATAPGWQARALSLVFRLLVKPKTRRVEDELRMAKDARRFFALPPVVRHGLIHRGVNVEPVTREGVSGEWIAPSAAGSTAAPVVFYVHGGGYIACSPETHRPLTTALSARARVRVFAPAYRLAPEHRFPAALEDVLAAYRWLIAQGVDPARLAVAGDSAGGGLALVLLVALRDAGLPSPACAALLCPWTDLAGTGASVRANSESDAMFYGDGLCRLSAVYAGGVSLKHPLVSPLYADLHGLPPLLLHASSSEILLDDSRRLHARALEQGVDSTLEIYRDLPHAWHMFSALAPEGRVALDAVARFIDRRCGRTRA